jgi:hypothetical protein
MEMTWLWILAIVVLPTVAQAGALIADARTELGHERKGQELHLSPPAVVTGRDGTPIVAWVAQEGDGNTLYVSRIGTKDSPPVRVNPAGVSVDGLHQSPGVAIAQNGDLYVTWSSRKPVPEGSFFASDLQLSRSVDGGRTFSPPLRINDDRPISHSFEGLATAADGTVLVSWIDTREGADLPRTYLGRVTEGGTKLDSVVKLDSEETCVCCRIAVATGPGERVAVLRRKVFPGSVRDMALGVSQDGGRSFAPPRLVHDDRWKISACPHRGGSLATDRIGRLYAAWYTEGRDETPTLLFAVSSDGRRFQPPTRLDVTAGTIPDHLRLAVDANGHVLAVWEEATAVRRRVVMRVSLDGGRTFLAPHAPSPALKASAPHVAVIGNDRFVAVWREEQFPAVKTVVQTFRLAGSR